MGASESTPTKQRTPTASPAPRPKHTKPERDSPRKDPRARDSPKPIRTEEFLKIHKEKQVTFSDRVEKKKIGHLRQVSLPEKPRSPVLKSSLKNSSSYPTSPVDERNFLFSGNDAGEAAVCRERPDSSKRKGLYVSSMEFKLENDLSLGRPGESGRVFIVSDNTCVFTRNKKQVQPRPISAQSTSFEFAAVKHVPVYVSSVDSLCYKKREKQTTEVETQTDECLEVRRPKRTESPLSRSRRSSGYASANGSPTVSRIELPDNVFAETAVSIGPKELEQLSVPHVIDTTDSEMAPQVTEESANTNSLDTESSLEKVEQKDCDQSKRKSSFRGFLRIRLNISRPISVVAGTTPPSLYDLLQADDSTSLAGKELTSFSLPRGAFKSVHVTSETTAGQLIVLLLKKFHVVDDPRKFALYEKYAENSDTTKAHMRRIEAQEKPLHIVLKWTAEERLGVFAEEKAELMHHGPPSTRSFVLQENESGDVAWDAFSVPELQTFLRILDREEAEYRNQIVQKYKNIRSQIWLIAESKRTNSDSPPEQIKIASSSSSESEDDEYLTMKRNKTLPLIQKYDKDRFADANDSDSDFDATLKPSSSKRLL